MEESLKFKDYVGVFLLLRFLLELVDDLIEVFFWDDIGKGLVGFLEGIDKEDDNLLGFWWLIVFFWGSLRNCFLCRNIV